MTVVIVFLVWLIAAVIGQLFVAGATRKRTPKPTSHIDREDW